MNTAFCVVIFKSLCHDSQYLGCLELKEFKPMTSKCLHYIFHRPSSNPNQSIYVCIRLYIYIYRRICISRSMHIEVKIQVEESGVWFINVFIWR